MATYLDGSVRKATPNTVTAMKRSAANRKCPKCGRKSALVYDHDLGAVYCRWSTEPYYEGRGIRRRPIQPIAMMCSYYKDLAEDGPSGP